MMDATGQSDAIERAMMARVAEIYAVALRKALRDKRIQKEYNGYNAKELAQKYELSVNWVLNICKDNPLPEQQSLF